MRHDGAIRGLLRDRARGGRAGRLTKACAVAHGKSTECGNIAPEFKHHYCTQCHAQARAGRVRRAPDGKHEFERSWASRARVWRATWLSRVRATATRTMDNFSVLAEYNCISKTRSLILKVNIYFSSVLGTVLLLNLLIVMLASTYKTIQEGAVKQVNFGRVEHTINLSHHNRHNAIIPPPLNGGVRLLVHLRVPALVLNIESLVPLSVKQNKPTATLKDQALLMFAEHRCFGESLPFGLDEADMKADNIVFLSPNQAMSDYAVLIDVRPSSFRTSSSFRQHQRPSIW